SDRSEGEWPEGASAGGSKRNGACRSVLSATRTCSGPDRAAVIPSSPSAAGLSWGSPGSVPSPRLSPFPHRDAPLIAASEGDDLEEPIVVEIGERAAVDHRQPARRPAAVLHAPPPPLSVP